MHLVLDGKTLSVGQLGPDFLLLDDPIDYPPTTAILFYSVDGKVRERPVHLPEGISAARERVLIAKV
jgi:hypothetical protein